MKISNDEYFIKELNTTLKNGGIIAFVTDTVWGIGCLPNNKDAVEKIYQIKKRDYSKPLILMSNNKENLYPYITNVSTKAKEIMEKYFPGALTLIFDSSEKTQKFVTANKSTVGIRVPDNNVFQRLCEKIDGHVLATTSANISGEPPALTYKSAFETLHNFVDIILENEEDMAKGEPSTVAQITDNKTLIFRQGSVNI
ncbi:threonylcarbamoyl-AMP synthase [bacterium]|nr:threonylcarbamoyl-AMP synthase [bacterium]